ncbi:hemagglutinin repeat-containing protein, partial [Pseudomonadota bacterium]
ELTQTQIDNLTTDIIWWVETQLNGETILVPKVYLSNTTKLAINNRRDIEETRMGNIAAENNITIDTEEEMLNEGGSIIANSILTLEADHIRNTASISTTTVGQNIISRLNSKGLMKANSMNLTASILTNAGSDLTATNNLSITADTVDIKTAVVVNQTLNESKKGWSLTRTEENISSSINAGSLVITSTNDTNIIGSNITTTGNANITTGGDLNIKSAQNKYYHESHSKKKKNAGMSSKSSTTNISRSTNVASNLNIGGDLTTNSDDNLIILASNVEADGNITLQADKNINIISGQDSYLKTNTSNKRGVTDSNNSKDAYETVTQVKSDINAGNNLNILSGQNTTIIASDLEAETGDTTIVAGRYTDGGGTTHIDDTATVTVMNAMDSTYTYNETTHEKMDAGAIAVGAASGLITGGAVGLIAGAYIGAEAKKGSSNVSMNYDETIVASNIEGQNISIQSAGNTGIQSSDITSTNDTEILVGKLRNETTPTQIDTVNEDAILTITSAQERHESYSKSEKFKPDYAGVAAGAAVAGALATAGGTVGNNIAGPLGQFAGTAAGVVAGTSAALQVNQRINKNESTVAQTNQIASNVTTGNNLTTNSTDTTNIIGSDIDSEGNITMTSDNDQINIASAIETTMTNTSGRDQSFSDVELTTTRSSAGVDLIQEVDKDETTVITNTQRSSNITSGGTFTSTSKNDTNILGSNIIATNDVNITSEEGDVNVLSAEQIQNIIEESEDITNTANASVSNEWVEALYKQNEMIKDYNDSKEGNTNFAVNYVDTALSVLLTLPTFGFAANASLTQEIANTESQTDNITNKASSVKSEEGNILLTANSSLTNEQDINVKGSNLLAEQGNIIITAKNDVNIEASKNTSTTSLQQKSDTLTEAYSSSDILPVSLTQGQSDTHAETRNTTYNNSTLTAQNGTINITTGEDATVSGANIEAEDIDLNIGNNLIVESKQNITDYRSETEGYSTQIGGNFNQTITQQKNKEQKGWVDNQTTIIGTNSVDIDTTNETNIKGAVIANKITDIDGNITDGGNLNINTGTLQYSDIKDTYSKENRGYTAGVGLDIQMAYNELGHEKEQITKATVGNGAITVGGQVADDGTGTGNNTLIAGLNRDISHTQEMIRDEETGGYDFGLTVNLGMVAGMVENGVDGYVVDQAREAKENVKKTKEKVENTYDNVMEWNDDRKAVNSIVLLNKDVPDKKVQEYIQEIKDTDSRENQRQQQRERIEFAKNNPKKYQAMKNMGMTDEQVVAYQRALVRGEIGPMLALTLYLEGTDLSNSRTPENSQEHGQIMADIIAKTFNDDGNGEYFYWDGGNTKEDRTKAANNLNEFISNYEFTEGESLNLVEHSHGGNVVKEWSTIYNGDKKVDIQTFLGTPHIDGYTFNSNVMSSTGTVYNVYDTGDWFVQDSVGGVDGKFTKEYPYITGTGIDTLNPSQILSSSTPNAINIEITQGGEYSTGDFIKNNLINKFTPSGIAYQFEGGVGAYDSHVGLNTPETWENYIEPEINK